MCPDALRNYLRTLRIKQHLTQRQLASAVGVREELIATWERGIVGSLKDVVLLQMAAVLHASLEDMTALATLRSRDAECGVAYARRRYEQLRRSLPRAVCIFGQISAELAHQIEEQSPIAARPGRRVYEGNRCGDMVHVLVNGEPLSPTLGTNRVPLPEFGWGHAGCSTVALARALLQCEFGAASARLNAETFVRDVLVEVPWSGAWVMESRELRRWVAVRAIVDNVLLGMSRE